MEPAGADVAGTVAEVGPTVGDGVARARLAVGDGVVGIWLADREGNWLRVTFAVGGTPQSRTPWRSLFLPPTGLSAKGAPSDPSDAR
jgi:hypothetical protein